MDAWRRATAPTRQLLHTYGSWREEGFAVNRASIDGRNREKGRIVVVVDAEGQIMVVRFQVHK
jgi:hypothetical protein